MYLGVLGSRTHGTPNSAYIYKEWKYAVDDNSRSVTSVSSTKGSDPPTAIMSYSKILTLFSVIFLSMALVSGIPAPRRVMRAAPEAAPAAAPAESLEPATDLKTDESYGFGYAYPGYYGHHGYYGYYPHYGYGSYYSHHYPYYGYGHSYWY